MKLIINNPEIIKTDEKLIFNVIDYYSLLSRLKDSNVIIHDKYTVDTLKNYLFNLDSIESEFMNLSENSKYVSLLSIKSEVIQNHIIFLASYIKAKLCNRGYINEDNEMTWGYDPIERIIHIEELLDNAFKWIEFVQYSKCKISKIIFAKYAEELSSIAYLYYSLVHLEAKAKESLIFSISKVNSEKCKIMLQNYETSLASIESAKKLLNKKSV